MPTPYLDRDGVAFGALARVLFAALMTVLCAPAYAQTSDSAFVDASTPISNDTMPPVLSSISVSDIDASSAIINWLTDEPADSQVEFLSPCPAGVCWSGVLSAPTKS